MPARISLPAIAGTLLFLLALGCAGSIPADTPAPLGDGESAVVDRVVDGDSLRLADGRTVRLLQIDAPELHGDCFGAAARSALRRLTPSGARVTIVADPQLDGSDAYGRLLRYVFASGRNANVALVRSGAASPSFFRKQRGRYAAQLLGAAREARQARRGYWGACPRAELVPGVGSVTGPVSSST